MSRVRGRLLAVAIGAALGAGVVGAWAASRRAAERAAFDARKREIAELLDERARSAAAPAVAQPRSRAQTPEERAWYLDEQTAGSLFYRDHSVEQYDPWSYHRHKPNLDLRVPWPEHPRGEWRYVTNSLGLREDAELLAVRPALRVLVTGDSQTDGFCDNRDAWPNLLERRLADERPSAAVEVINAGNGGFSPYHHLGALERFLPLEPDVFIVVIFTGNDFLDVRNARAYFAKETLPEQTQEDLDLTHACNARSHAVSTQGLGSAIALGRHADEALLLVDTVTELVLEMRALCAGAGTQFMCMLLPSPIDVPGEPAEALAREIAVELGLGDEILHFNARMGAQLVERLARRGCKVYDALPALAAAAPPRFWQKDQHLNLAGQRALADAVHRELLALRSAAGD
jgi:lysophospholipase L1-like esterase